MKKTILYTLLALLPVMASAQDAETDNAVLMSGEQEGFPESTTYTISVRKLQLKDDNSEAKLIMRTGESSRGADLLITPTTIKLATDRETVIVADGLPDGLKSHDYTVTSTTVMRIYRDGVQLGRITTRTFDEETARFELVGVSNVNEGYEFTLVSNSAVQEPSQLEYETNVENMLTQFTNLSTDPYLNTGFMRSGNSAAEREFYTAEAKNLGWGSDIWAEVEQPYSGPMCVRLSGQSMYPDQGAALKQAITFKPKTPYVVRAMVKSDGWEGMIGVADEQNFIHITDTHGEWQQVEAVLYCQYSWNASSNETFYVHNADYESDGTLLIDNIEVYEGIPGISVGSRTELPAASIPAGTTWRPASSISVYRLGFTEKTATNYSQIDPSGVTITGAPYFTRTFLGSRLYAIHFPGDVVNVTHTGRVDGWDNYEMHLYHGIDFICQRLNEGTGQFEYLDDEAPLTAGSYIIQFADNYEGIPVRFDFKPGTSAETMPGTYWMQGNAVGYDIDGEAAAGSMGTVLYFNEDTQVFSADNVESTTLRPFAACLCTTDPNIRDISPEGSTGILRLQAAQGGDNMLVRPTRGGIVLTARKASRQPIYTISGQRIQLVSLSEGDNYIALPAGIYIAAGKKVIVR